MYNACDCFLPMTKNDIKCNMICIYGGGSQDFSPPPEAFFFVVTLKYRKLYNL